MDKENSLYELTKQLSALQHLHDKQQQSKKIKSKLELRDITRECFKTFNTIVAIPPTFCDNAVEKERTEEAHLVIERKNGPYFQDLKEKVDQLFMMEEMQINEAKLPDDLEEGMVDLKTEIQEQKEQLKLYTCLANNLDVILENNFSNQISVDNSIFERIETDSMEKDII